MEQIQVNRLPAGGGLSETASAMNAPAAA